MAHLLKSFLSIPNFLVVHDCRQNRLSADVAKEDGGHRSRQKDDDGTNGQSEKCGGKSRRRPYAAARRKPRHWAREQSVEAPLPDRSRSLEEVEPISRLRPRGRARGAGRTCPAIRPFQRLPLCRLCEAWHEKGAVSFCGAAPALRAKPRRASQLSTAVACARLEGRSHARR